MRPQHRAFGHGLAEADGRGLQQAATGAAVRHLVRRGEGGVDVVDLVAFAAIQAVRVGGVAVQLDDRCSGMPEAWCRPSMFWVMTAATLPSRTSARHRAVAAIGLGGAHDGIAVEAAAPGFAPGWRRTRQKSWNMIGFIWSQSPSPGCGNRVCRIPVLMPAPGRRRSRPVRSSLQRADIVIHGRAYPQKTQGPGEVSSPAFLPTRQHPPGSWRRPSHRS